MNKFTPGPWVVGYTSHKLGVLEIIQKHDTRGPAGDRTGIPLAEVHNINSGNVFSDAALIAAAPEMFEMLFAIWVNVPSHILDSCDIDDAEVCAVISKAKGV